jgi:delta8-fatty-acid desaturase
MLLCLSFYHVALFTLTSVAIMFSIVVYGVVGCTSIWAHLGSGMFWVCF